MRTGPSVFYNPDDDADSDYRKPGGGTQPSPRMARLRKCVTAAMLIRSTTTNETARLRQMKAHIMGLRLPVSRLAALWSNARDEAILYAFPEHAPLQLKRAPIDGAPMAEYAKAAWLVMRATLALLVKVPLANNADAEGFVSIVTLSGYVLPRREQSRAISIARRYVECAILDKPFRAGGAA
jgi:hypothetical protein